MTQDHHPIVTEPIPFRRPNMKQAELLSDLDKNGTAILRTRMPIWENVWYVIPRPRGPRYVGVLNREPPVLKPSRVNPNRFISRLLRDMFEVIFFMSGGMDRTEITFVHPSYAVALGEELVRW